MKKLKIIKILVKLFLLSMTIIMLAYPIAVFSNNPFIKKWRDIYIETAMTTMHHQWLATSFLPDFVIDDVMNENSAEKENLQNFTVVWDSVTYAKESELYEEPEALNIKSSEEEFYEKYWELDTDEFRAFLAENPEFLENDYDNLFIDNSNYKYNIK